MLAAPSRGGNIGETWAILMEGAGVNSVTLFLKIQLFT